MLTSLSHVQCINLPSFFRWISGTVHIFQLCTPDGQLGTAGVSSGGSGAVGNGTNSPAGENGSEQKGVHTKYKREVSNLRRLSVAGCDFHI